MSAGPGYNDARGIRLYGEADLDALFSDLLNLGLTSVSAQILVDRNRMTTIESAVALADSSQLMGYQTDTTSSTKRLVTKAGKGMIQGAGAATVNETVTFPSAFKAGTVPVVVASLLGYRVHGAYNEIGLLVNSLEAANATGPIAASFNLHIVAPGATLSAANDYYYAWIAIGEAP